MATTSNPPDASARMQEDVYLYASNTNVSNFVSVKLSGDSNYHIWKKQMDCLMKTHDLCSLLDDHPQETTNKINKYDSLLQGWILGSLSEEVLEIVVNCVSAKETWKKLKEYFDSPKSSQQDSAKSNANDKGGNPAESEAIGKVATGIKTKDSHPITIVDPETETRDKNVSSAITTANDKGGNQAESEAKGKEATQSETTEIKRLFKEAISKGHWHGVLKELLLHEDARKAPINSVGNTVLHIAVGLRYDFILKRVLRRIKKAELTVIKNFEGSTLLHIAAIVGNTSAAKLLIKHEKGLLNTPDNKGKKPLEKAYEHMHLDTIDYLLTEAAKDDSKAKTHASRDDEEIGVKMDSEKDDRKAKTHASNDVEDIGVNLLVNAFSAKQYDFASKLLEKHPAYATSDNRVLMAMARTFPSGLDHEETFVYPNLGNKLDEIVNRSKRLFEEFEDIWFFLKDDMSSLLRRQYSFQDVDSFFYVFQQRWCILFIFPWFLTHFLCFITYYGSSTIWNLEKKKKEYDHAKRILDLVCEKIEEKHRADSDDSFYEGPFLEAARQNASEVVDRILKIWPQAINLHRQKWS
ncbi:putative ankyrin repeat-containing domain-containing protein [Helianthus debilis subsp. tardiflorus]